MNKEITINKNNKSITFINNGIAFSQFGVADEILDLIIELQEELKYQKEMEIEYNEKHTKLMKKYTKQKDIKANKKAIEEINKRSSKEVAKLYIDILKGE